MTDREMLELVGQLIERFEAVSSNAYFQYINLCRKDECLGWEEKVDCKKFGYDELRAHMDAQEMLGRHRAFSDAAKMLREALPCRSGAAAEIGRDM